MAEKDELTIVMKLVDNASKQMGTALETVNQKLDSLTKNQKKANQATKEHKASVKDFAAGAVAAYIAVEAAIRSLSGAYNLAKNAAQFDSLKRNFKGLADSQGVDADRIIAKMKEVSRGTVDEMTLISGAALNLGANMSESQVVELLEVSRKAAKQFGKDAVDTYQRISQAVVTGEQDSIDQLGLQLDLTEVQKNYLKAIDASTKKLSAYGKQQALLNGIFEVAKTKFAGVNSEVIDAADGFAIAESASRDLYKEVGQFLVPAFLSLAAALLDTAVGIKSFMLATSVALDTSKGFFDPEVIAQFEALNKEAERSKGVWDAASKSFDKLVHGDQGSPDGQPRELKTPKRPSLFEDTSAKTAAKEANDAAKAQEDFLSMLKDLSRDAVPEVEKLSQKVADLREEVAKGAGTAAEKSLAYGLINQIQLKEVEGDLDRFNEKVNDILFRDLKEAMPIETEIAGLKQELIDTFNAVQKPTDDAGEALDRYNAAQQRFNETVQKTLPALEQQMKMDGIIESWEKMKEATEGLKDQIESLKNELDPKRQLEKFGVEFGDLIPQDQLEKVFNASNDELDRMLPKLQLLGEAMRVGLVKNADEFDKLLEKIIEGDRVKRIHGLMLDIADIGFNAIGQMMDLSTQKMSAKERKQAQLEIGRGAVESSVAGVAQFAGLPPGAAQLLGKMASRDEELSKAMGEMILAATEFLDAIQPVIEIGLKPLIYFLKANALMFQALEYAVEHVLDPFEWLYSALKSAVDGINAFIDALGKIFSLGLPGVAGKAAKSVVGSVVGGVIGGPVGAAMGALGGLFHDGGYIQSAHNGRMISGLGDVPIIAQAGEMVLSAPDVKRLQQIFPDSVFNPSSSRLLTDAITNHEPIRQPMQQAPTRPTAQSRAINNKTINKNFSVQASFNNYSNEQLNRDQLRQLEQMARQNRLAIMETD